MDIYNSRFFILAVTLQKTVGLWPYDSKVRRVSLQCLGFLGIFMMGIPQAIGLSKTIKTNTDQAMHHMAVLMYTVMVFMKLFTSITAEKSLKSLYDNVQINSSGITDKEENQVLLGHFETARITVLLYTIYTLGGVVLFVLVPVVPVVLDVVFPLENRSRENIYLLDGDFIIDRNEHFVEIYLYDLYTAFATVGIIASVDAMYVVCTEQCVGLFSIIRYRFHKIGEQVTGRKDEDTDYQMIKVAAKMHQSMLSFAKVISDTYKVSFFILTGINLIYFSTLSVLLIINYSNPLNLFRFTLLLLFLAVHLFYLSWPGQKFIDSSTNLFNDAYYNKWYETSKQSKGLLHLIYLRCMKPCELTAGGLYVMNFENYMKVMKTSISYITVFSSFR